MYWEVILRHPAWDNPVWDIATGVSMVVATILLVVATRQLANSAKRQTDFLERQERRELRLGYYTDHNGHHYGGFELTNVGIPSVTITWTGVALGIPETDNAYARYIASDWVTERQGKEVSNFQPPHRLLTGDSIKVLYDLDKMGHGILEGRRIRYECRDSFGNTYVSAWVEYSKSPRRMIAHNSPGKEFREPEIGGTVIRA